MILIRRYVTIEIAIGALASIGFFLLVFLTGNALRDALSLFTSGRIPLGAFLNLLLLLIPFVLAYALPLGTVTGILITLGRLSGNHEITAMRASGMSLFQITVPILAFATLASIGSAAFNLYFAPENRSLYKSTIRNVVRENPVAFIRPGEMVREFPGFIIYTHSVEEQTVRGFWIWEIGPNGFPQYFIQADRGTIHYDESSQMLVIDLERGIGERRFAPQPHQLAHPDVIRLTTGSYALSLSLDKILGSSGKQQRLQHLGLPALLDLLKRLDSEASDLPPAQRQIERSRVLYQIHSNIAMSLSTLTLSLVAIPLGIRVGRKESYTNIAIALILSLLYFFTTAISGWFEKSPSFYPHLLVHLPNLCFGLAGIYLFRRIDQR